MIGFLSLKSFPKPRKFNFEWCLQNEHTFRRGAEMKEKPGQDTKTSVLLHNLRCDDFVGLLRIYWALLTLCSCVFIGILANHHPRKAVHGALHKRRLNWTWKLRFDYWTWKVIYLVFTWSRSVPLESEIQAQHNEIKVLGNIVFHTFWKPTSLVSLQDQTMLKGRLVMLECSNMDV